MSEESKEAEARAELQRLRVKQSAVDDTDIRLALQARIDALETEVANHKKAPTPDAESAVAEKVEATPEQVKVAENLIRQSRVEKMRGNKGKALTLMKEAAEVAANAPAVLEALGDDYAEQRQYKNARDTYRRAKDLQPGNVGLEQKHALMALRAQGMSSVDAQLRAGVSDSLLISGNDSVAGLGAARFFNALIPGVGHLTLGRNGAGIGLLVVWLGCGGWLIYMQRDIVLLASMVTGHGAHPNLLVLVPMFVAFIDYIIGITSLGVDARSSARKTIAHPAPPVDLPFD